MSDLLVDAPPPAPAPDPTPEAAPPLALALAGLMAASGVIHFVMIPAHAGSGLTEPLLFAVAGWLQLTVAGAILANRAGRGLYQAAVALNLGILAMWVWSRTSGLPFGAHKNEAESIGFVDGATALMEVAGILLAAYLILAPSKGRAGRLAPAMAAVAFLGLATVVITSPDAASHGGADHHGTEAGADHHSTDANLAEMAAIDAKRCDKSFNPVAYWEVTKYLGIDTYQGGAMAADHHATAPAGASGSTASAPPATDPLGGRGSEGLDKLVTLTDAADGGELAAAQLVSGLSAATDEDYEAWLYWMRSTGAASHGHAGSTNSDEVAGGHGGHSGPGAWTALTDPAQCKKLADELALARETALKYQTAADAMEAGWELVTPYVPGIGAHYMKFSVVDGKFQIDQPEMILYDGSGPDANVVGLSYYMIHEGDAEPTQGFTGDNDHGHRHQGLCTKDGVTIGDTTTSEEDCKARGGNKSDGSRGWMSHAWVVPGCESPWGVFSAATPTLDTKLALESGENDGGCSASGAHDRYDLRPGTAATAAVTASVTDDTATG